MAQRTRAPADGPVKLHTIKASAEHLGCSEMHIYRLITTGVLRAVDIARPGAHRTKTRIRSDDLADYIDRQTRSSAPAGRAS